jgi:hypothetical protein
MRPRLAPVRKLPGQLVELVVGMQRGLDNEDSPQQATGYQKENRLLMRNHGFSNSSL